MPTNKETVSVRLPAASKRRIEQSARLQKQSAGAFLETAGKARARDVLIEWAVEKHRLGEATFSEVAQETGLSVEEIMSAPSRDDWREGLDAFIASCRA